VLIRARRHPPRDRLRAALTKASADIEEVVGTELALVERGPMALPTAAAASGQRGGSRVAAVLTARECEVLDLLAAGMTNAAAADRLVLSEGTVKSHLKRILRKLHVTNRSEAVAKYLHLRRLDEEHGV
jgi:DNA-binding NarL/FixJ family response regulator